MTNEQRTRVAMIRSLVLNGKASWGAGVMDTSGQHSITIERHWTQEARAALKARQGAVEAAGWNAEAKRYWAEVVPSCTAAKGFHHHGAWMERQQLPYAIAAE